MLFQEQTAEALMSAVQRIESGVCKFDPSVLHSHALKFDKSVFKEYLDLLLELDRPSDLCLFDIQNNWEFVFIAFYE